MESFSRTAIDARKREDDSGGKKDGKSNERDFQSKMVKKQVEKVDAKAEKILDKQKENIKRGKKTSLIHRCKSLMARYGISLKRSPHFSMDVEELDDILNMLETEVNIRTARKMTEKGIVKGLRTLEAFCSPRPLGLGIPALQKLDAFGLEQEIVGDEDFPDIVDGIAGEWGWILRNIGPLKLLLGKVGIALAARSKEDRQAAATIAMNRKNREDKQREMAVEESMDAADRKYNV